MTTNSAISRHLRVALERHPLLCVLAAAALARFLAAVFARGFLATDDHFETVRIAAYWVEHGLWDAKGFLTWTWKGSEAVARNPAYTLTLYGILKPLHALGITSMDTQMYIVRGMHGLFSLSAVYAVYRIVELSTGSRRWSLVAGLAAGLHFAIPFLAVRNLIEMVGGTFWILSLLQIYRFSVQGNQRALVWSGILAGIGWAVRFQLVAAFVLVPIILLWQTRRLVPVLLWSAGLCFIIVVSGYFEYLMVGSWWGGTTKHFSDNLGVTQMYNTPALVYLFVILGAFFPPLSVLFVWWSIQPQVWKKHLPLIASTISFVLIHSLYGNRQERFMIPILYSLITLFVIAVWGWIERGRIQRFARFVGPAIAYLLAVNVIFLVLFTFTYRQRGIVEPLVLLEDRPPGSAIIFSTPGKERLFPVDYAGLGWTNRHTIKGYPDPRLAGFSDSNRMVPVFCIVYPDSPDEVAWQVDSLSRYFGGLDLLTRVGPSMLDHMLHRLNPKHNDSDEAWLYGNRAAVEYWRKRQEVAVR